MLDINKISRMCNEIYPREGTNWEHPVVTMFTDEKLGEIIKVQALLDGPYGNKRIICFISKEEYDASN